MGIPKVNPGVDNCFTDYAPISTTRSNPSMPILNRIADFHQDLTAWRRDIHAHPETAFEEQRTSDVVAQRLEEFGIEIHRGLAGTGVVGTLKGARPGPRAIAIRADMDALDVHEKNGFHHVSTHKGKMHACGHDGTPPCCWARRAISRRPGTSRARCISSSSPRRRTRPADASWWSRGSSRNSRSRRSTACTIGRACRSGSSRCARGRCWPPSTSSRSWSRAKARTPPCHTPASIPW